MDRLIQEQRPTEIAHVLFVDIVGYSRETTATQSRMVAALIDAVRASQTYRSADENEQVLTLPTGDGMAILFFGDLAAPAKCALQLAKLLESTPVKVRMGIHSGPIQRQRDINGKENVVGEAINTAQRVMDLGEGGHILVSAQYTAWLRQFDEWQPLVSELGRGTTKHGEGLTVFALRSGHIGRGDVPSGIRPQAETPISGRKVVILYKRKAQPDDQVLGMLESALGSAGHDVFVDRHLKIGVDWAKAIEAKIRASDVAIAIISDAAIGSEMLEYELETAHDESRKRGKPYLLPVRVGSDKVVDGVIGSYINNLNFCVWGGPQDNRRVVSEIEEAMTEPPKLKEERPLEPVGGAVPPDSPFYIERETDAEFGKALRAGESILLVKGPRQVGKTSMIGRGIGIVRELGWRHASTDFQKLSTSQLGTEDVFYKLLAATLARQMKFTYDFAAEWMDVFGANMNMDNFIRALLEASDEPLVWFMDEADKLFGVPFASDFFGLVRSWHNSRATEPHGPWSRFTVVIGYATEAHLFIQDLNQSPFNVGRQLLLRNFTLAQTADLNARYGSPLAADETRQLWELVGGQPFLTRRALDVVGRGTLTFADLLSTSTQDEGAFGDHLKRILISVSQMPGVLDALRASISNPEFQESEGLQRLIAAGVMMQSGQKVELVCDLYRRYLRGHLRC